MAIYVFECYRCNKKVEFEIPMSEYDPDDPPVCPHCSEGRMKRFIERTAKSATAAWRKDGSKGNWGNPEK